MFASVVILRRMPKGLDRLDYRLPRNMTLKPGMMVTVPFRKKILPAIITGIYANSHIAETKIKTILTIVNKEPFLSINQIQFTEEMAEMYQTSLGFLFKSSLPPWKKRKIDNLQLSHHTATKISPALKPTLLIATNEAEIKTLILNKIDPQKNNLILVPTIERARQWQQFLITNHTDHSVITGEYSEKEMFALWTKIRNQTAGIIVGTRRAFFLPWFNLGNIFLENDSDENHKTDEMAPRFHNRDACLILSARHGANFFCVSYSPSPDTYYFAKHGTFHLVGTLQSFKPTATIINLREERKKNNYGIWSEELKKQLTLNKGGDVFLFLNRRGSAHYVGCRDCGYTAQCPQCARALIYHATTNSLYCHFCQFKKPALTRCPNCHGVSVVMYGAGTELVANEAQKKWSDKYQIVRIDSDAPSTIIKNNLPHLFIGTQLAWKQIDWHTLSLMVFLDIDTELFQPDFRATENIWHSLYQAANQLRSNAALLIQTSHPEHRLFSCLHRPEIFYENELTERQALNYPPFNYLVRLWRGFKDPETAKKGGGELLNKLQILTKTVPGIIISGLLEMTPFYYEQHYWQVILIRLPYAFYKKYTKIISGIAPPEWKLDPGPTRLLSLL